MASSVSSLQVARRLCATIQLELKARTFDYAKRFPDSDRIKQRGIETPEKIEPISVTELTDSWLLSKQGEVKKSTHGYYKEVAGIFIQRDAIGTKTVSELHQEDIDRWRVRVDSPTLTADPSMKRMELSEPPACPASWLDWRVSERSRSSVTSALRSWRDPELRRARSPAPPLPRWRVQKRNSSRIEGASHNTSRLAPQKPPRRRLAGALPEWTRPGSRSLDPERPDFAFPFAP